MPGHTLADDGQNGRLASGLQSSVLEFLPLFLAVARPMKVEWNKRPYFGVFPLVLRALKRAFSAPKIWTVDAGYFANLVNEPA